MSSILFHKIEGNIKLTELRTPVLIFSIAMMLRLLFLAGTLAGIGPEHIIDQYPDPIKYVRAADYLFGGGDTGQYELFLVGVGYPFFVAICTTIFGHAYWAILVLQIILSSLSCVIIYKIAELLTNIRPIAVIAGLLSAVSITSVSLASAVMGETLFFFLLTLSLYLFFKGLAENRWSTVASAGIFGGLTVLVRSVAMFIPVLFVIFALIFPAARIVAGRKQLISKSIVAALIMITIPALWGLRNVRVHDTFTVSGTGVLAAKTYLTAKVLIQGQGRHTREFVPLRDSLYRASLAKFEVGNYRQNHSESFEFIISAIKKYPMLFLKNYFSIILTNVTAVSSLHHIQLPQFTKIFEFIDTHINRGLNNPLGLIFSLTGFVILARKNLNVAFILLSIVIYFAMMSGVTFAQGSRIFFPAQVTQSILVAATILFFYDLIIAGKNLLLSKRR